MQRVMTKVGTTTLWMLALFVALAAARYFLVPPLWLRPPIPTSLMHGLEADAVTTIAPHLYEHHRVLFLVHVGGGIIAMVLGLFQFVPRLRSRYPRVHRRIGYCYASSVVTGAIAALPLAFVALEPLSPDMRFRLRPMLVAVLTLAVAWLLTALVAVFRARQGLFAPHRAWMMRSYSLTFSAATVRFIAPIVLLATSDAITATNIAFMSWPLNLLVAEWLMRRRGVRFAEPMQARATVAGRA